MSNKYKKTIVLGLDYSEFSGGISDCNRKMGLLNAEMQRATEEAKLYGTETDQLSIKQQGLRQKIELQKKKVEESVKAYEKAVTAHGELSKATDTADKALLNERTTLLKLQNELQNTEEKIKDAEDENKTFGDSIREVADFIGVSANPMIEAFADKFDSVDEKVGLAVLTIGTMVTTLGNLTLKTAESAKEIINTSQTMGMTTKEYQEWDYVLKTVGYDAESASGDLAALSEKAMDAASGAGEGAELFAKLGMSVKDSSGNLKNQNQLFTETILRLQMMEDKTERNAIASAMLSTTGEKLVPILNMTKQELHGLIIEANETGYVMSGNTLDGFNDLNKAMQEFDSTTEALGNSFAVALLPLLTTFFECISSIPTPVLQMLITLAGVVTSLVAIVSAVESTVGAFDKFTDFLSGVDAKTLKTTGIIIGIVAALIALAAVIAVISGRGDELSRTMENVGSSVGNIQAGLNGSTSQARHHASGTEFFPGGETWVGEEGPELVRLPRGSRIINAEESKKSSSTVNNFNITIPARDIKEFNDIVRIVSREQVSIRTGRAIL